MSEPPPTLKAIAIAAKVSGTTVSLALRNHPKISEPVRNRIRQLAKEMGYRPNALVSAHMARLRALHPQNTGQSIAFVCNRSLAEFEISTRQPIWAYYCGAMKRANELGYGLQFFNLEEPGMSPKRTSEILWARSIPGLIIAPLSAGFGVTEFPLQRDDFAMAAIEFACLHPRLHMACHDMFSTVCRTIQRLLDDGYRRIGIALYQRMDEHTNHQCRAGFSAFQALTNPEDCVPAFITRQWDQASFMHWFERWKPEAIITVNDDIVNWLSAGKIGVPDDVSCVSLYWREHRPHLAGFYQNHEEMGACAVDLVVAQLNHNERGLPSRPKTVLVQADWKDGATHRPKGLGADRSPFRFWVRENRQELVDGT